MILSYTLLLPVSLLQTQQVTTSQNEVTHRIFDTGMQLQ